MKRFLLCAACFLFCFALCSCGANDKGESDEQNTIEAASVESDEQVQTDISESLSSVDNEENPGNSAATDNQTTDFNTGVTVSREVIIEEGSDIGSENINNLAVKDADELRSFFDSLNYHSYTSDGLPEYNICFDDGVTYYVNLSSKWVWKGAGKEAALTEESLSELQVLLGVE